MNVKITVTGPDGQNAVDVVDVQETGDLAAAIGRLFDKHRTQFPDAPPFEKHVKVEQA